MVLAKTMELVSKARILRNCVTMLAIVRKDSQVIYAKLILTNANRHRAGTTEFARPKTVTVLKRRIFTRASACLER